MLKTFLKIFALAGILLFTANSTYAQLYQKFPTNVRYIGGGFNNVRPFFKTLEAALNDVKPFATSSNPYGFWIASDTLWIADWDSVFTESGYTMKDSIDIYYVATGKIKWLPFGFGGSGGSGTLSIITQDDSTLHYKWPTWDQTNTALPLWQRQEGARDDSVDAEIWRLIVYTKTPLYIENDTLKIDTTGFGGTGSTGWDPDTTTVVRTTGNQTIAGTKTFSGTLNFTGNLQLPFSEVTPGVARHLWGTTSNIYYSMSGAAGDTALVALIDNDTKKLIRDTSITESNFDAALRAFADSTRESFAAYHISLSADGPYTPDVTQNIPFKLLPTFTTEDNSGFTVAGDTVTTLHSGDYLIMIAFTLSGSATNDFSFMVRINNTVVHTFRATPPGASEYTIVSSFHYADGLSVSDDISFYVTNTSNSNDPIISYMNVYINRIHQ